jgi:hypothetical protein
MANMALPTAMMSTLTLSLPPACRLETALMVQDVVVDDDDRDDVTASGGGVVKE